MREGGVILCALCLALVLLFERLRLDAGVKVAKPLASAGFLLCAIGSEALASDYGLALLAALLLSWFGDVFLMFRGSQSLFKAGILSFLLGHLGFIVAFSVGGVSPLWSLLAVPPTLALAFIVLRWLAPHVDDTMRLAVRAYIGVISVMVVVAAGTPAAGQEPLRLAAACAFFGSDLAVARERFVVSSYTNRLWGLPLYYIAQLTFALTI